MAPSDPFGRPRPPLRRTLPTAALALALPLAVIVVPPSTPESWVLDRSTAAAVTPADVPGSDVAERWRWTGTEVVAVEPAGTGLVVLASEQVTALDGPTGAEVWHWFRQGVHVSEIGVSPDHATVVIRYVAAGVDGLDVLDAITGQRLWSAQPGGHLDDALTRPAELLVTDAAVVLGQGDEGYHAYGLHDGRALWEQTTGCDSIDIPVSTVLVRREDCEALGDVIGIDSADGAELWRWNSGGPTAPTEFTPTVVDANGALAVRFSRDDEAHVGRVDPVTGEMVDTPQAGAVQLVISSGPWDVLDRRDEPEVIDPATGERAVLSLPGESDMRPWWHTCSAGTERLWCYVDQRDTDGALAAVDPVTGQANLTELNVGGDRVQEQRMLPAPGVIAMLVWEGPYPGERDTLIGFTQPG
ncbi:PQQ-binding-like beta-propeller repeat protein [Ruania alba]|uniref:outer membrane protein assembly factor BamB family protein n=1 Tax=Ruania alba TaxID=648782 RepID=UPI001587242E|nr:PQQ-binding-like beta-propeller repeat protein [Ruania alba]